MISITLDTKKCMSELLLRETFDTFLFIEGEITTFNTFSIDGYIHPEFYGSEAQESQAEPVTASGYSTWDQVREFCFSIIRGKRTPLDFKLIFSLPEQRIRGLIDEKKLDFQPESVQGLYLNFRYDGTKLTCTTGTSLHIFTLDKSLEHGFDQWVREFFTGKGIEWEEA